MHKVSHRVIADHLRSAAFLRTVFCHRMRRGYVLRRIMRRAMRHAQLPVPLNRIMVLPALKSDGGCLS